MLCLDRVDADYSNRLRHRLRHLPSKESIFAEMAKLIEKGNPSTLSFWPSNLANAIIL